VAQRIGCYAEAVDRERFIAGVDCDFGTAVRTEPLRSAASRRLSCGPSDGVAPARKVVALAANRARRCITAATGQSRSSIPQIYFAGFAWDAALK